MMASFIRDFAQRRCCETRGRQRTCEKAVLSCPLTSALSPGGTSLGMEATFRGRGSRRAAARRTGSLTALTVGIDDQRRRPNNATIPTNLK